MGKWEQKSETETFKNGVFGSKKPAAGEKKWDIQNVASDNSPLVIVKI